MDRTSSSSDIYSLDIPATQQSDICQNFCYKYSVDRRLIKDCHNLI